MWLLIHRICKPWQSLYHWFTRFGNTTITLKLTASTHIYSKSIRCLLYINCAWHCVVEFTLYRPWNLLIMHCSNTFLLLCDPYCVIDALHIYMQCSCQHPGAPLGCSGPVPQCRSDSSGTQKEWSTALGGSGQAARFQQSSGYDSYQCHREAGEHDEFKGVKWHLLFQESPRGNDRGNGTPRHPQRAEYRSRIWGNC